MTEPTPDYTQVCLVEDDPIMGESIVSRFELEGLSIHWHQDAAAARQALLNNDYGLVISDIRLPDRNGDRLFEELLERQLLLPPFIFSSSRHWAARSPSSRSLPRRSTALTRAMSSLGLNGLVT